MLHVSRKSICVLAAVCSIGFGCTQASAAEASLDCKLKFSLSTWSAIYKHAEGSGVVTCENGSSLRVAISSKGGVPVAMEYGPHCCRELPRLASTR